jgi:hypothetical protein
MTDLFDKYGDCKVQVSTKDGYFWNPKTNSIESSGEITSFTLEELKEAIKQEIMTDIGRMIENAQKKIDEETKDIVRKVLNL